MNHKKIGVLVGSLRKKSFSQSVANAAIQLAPNGLELTQIDIGTLPIFNQDLDEENRPPQQWAVFRDTAKTLDGFLFVTPEYNRSLPPVLKNALDIGSRPSGQNLWDGKPGGVIGVSPGRIGGFGAIHHLRQILTCLNVSTMQQPETYIGGVNALLDGAGIVTNEQTLKLLQRFMTAFADWVYTVS